MQILKAKQYNRSRYSGKQHAKREYILFSLNGLCNNPGVMIS